MECLYCSFGNPNNTSVANVSATQCPRRGALGYRLFSVVGHPFLPYGKECLGRPVEGLFSRYGTTPFALRTGVSVRSAGVGVRLLLKHRKLGGRKDNTNEYFRSWSTGDRFLFSVKPPLRSRPISCSEYGLRFIPTIFGNTVLTIS